MVSNIAEYAFWFLAHIAKLSYTHELCECLWSLTQVFELSPAYTCKLPCWAFKLSISRIRDVCICPMCDFVLCNQLRSNSRKRLWSLCQNAIHGSLISSWDMSLATTNHMSYVETYVTPRQTNSPSWFICQTFFALYWVRDNLLLVFLLSHTSRGSLFGFL